MKLIIDTNLIFSALLKPHSLMQAIIRSRLHEIYVLQYTAVELFKYKEKILRYSKLTEDEVYTAYYDLLRHLRTLDEDDIDSQSRVKAQILCDPVDPKDSVYVAAALCLDAYIWTGDKELQSGLLKYGWNRCISTAELAKTLV